MKRPKFLTIFLALLTFFNVYFLCVNIYLIVTHPGVPWWGDTFWILITITQFVGIIMLWMWKKMGFYLLVGCLIIESIFSVDELAEFGYTGLYAFIVMYCLLYLAMRPVWKKFK